MTTQKQPKQPKPSNTSVLQWKEDGRHPIFYNLYIAPKNVKNTMKIAEEQMRQRELLAPGSPVYYTLIAQKNVSSQFCEPNCRQRAHLKEGHEVDTIQALWEYCRVEDHAEEWVTYLHDKGSFHDNGNNKRARKIATRAALACRKLFLRQDPKSMSRRNVCGATFVVLPQFQTSAK